jgi:hypothetical protein
MKEYGPERVNHMFALRSFIDGGIRPTQASDYPPGPFEPMMALQSEVTRTDAKGNVWGPQQKITLEEAHSSGHPQWRLRVIRRELKGSISLSPAVVKFALVPLTCQFDHLITKHISEGQRPSLVCRNGSRSTSAVSHFSSHRRIELLQIQ